MTPFTASAFTEKWTTAMESNVAIGYVHNALVHAAFTNSLVGLVRHENAITIPRWSTANISGARNEVVRAFLETDLEWLFMVDTDTVFTPDTIARLMKNEKEIVGGLIHIDGNTKYPSMFFRQPDREDGTPEYEILDNYIYGSCVRVDATGAACLLVHRTVFENIQRWLPNPAAQWFQELQVGNTLCSEDVVFCMRAESLDYEIFVDTSVNVGHIKVRVI